MSTAMNRLVRQGTIPQYKDATAPIFIHVTAIDVKRGKKFAPDQCVLAKATCRALPNAVQAWFYRSAAYVLCEDPKTGKRTTTRYSTSGEARQEIDSFDKRGEFRVGNFRIDPPAKSLTLKAIRKRSKARPGRHQPAKHRAPRIGARSPKGVTRGRVQYALAY